jgi:ribosomal protein L31E
LKPLTNKVPVKIIELELQIKLLEYLKESKAINDDIYNYCINKILKKIKLERNKINNDYINNINNYKILT